MPPVEDEHQPLIAREAVRPGTALALGSIGYATVAAFVVLHLDARGVGHGATVFGAFATMVVLTRLRRRRPARTGSAPPGSRSAPPRRGAGPGRDRARPQPPGRARRRAGDGGRLLAPLPLAVADRRQPRLRRPARRGARNLHRLLRRRRRPRRPARRPAWPRSASYEGAFLFAAIALASAATIAVATTSAVTICQPLRGTLAGGARALGAERQETLPSSRWARSRRLGGAADPAALVEEDRLGGADAVLGCGTGDGVDADPLALGHPLEVDGEIDVDEEVGAASRARR